MVKVEAVVLAISGSGRVLVLGVMVTTVVVVLLVMVVVVVRLCPWYW